MVKENHVKKASLWLGCFRLLRIKHWVKNLLILFPLFFSKRFFDGNLLLTTLLGVLAFGLCSSAIYVFNDIMDADADSKNPLKKNRPIASGQVSKARAMALCATLALLSVLCSACLRVSWAGAACLALYALLNVAYSLRLKRVPVADVSILSSGYLLRVLYGGIVSGIEISHWLFLTILCFSLYLGMGKRRGEYTRVYMGEHPETARAVLSRYSLSYLTAHMFLFLGTGVVFYSLWALEQSRMIYTVPLLLLIVMQYNLAIEATDGDPISTLYSSKVFAVLLLSYAAVVVFLLYY